MVVTSTPVMVHMPPELRDRADNEAKRQGISRADVIRLALREYLDKREPDSK